MHLRNAAVKLLWYFYNYIYRTGIRY